MEQIFAYGSNMCLERLEQYGVSPIAEGKPAELRNFALRFNKRSTADGSGKGNVVSCPGVSVWGVLFEITAAELTALNRGEGGYTPRRVMVQVDGTPVDAWCHLANANTVDDALHPYTWYKRLVVEGARAHNLPNEYVAHLEQVHTTVDSQTERAQRWNAVDCSRKRRKATAPVGPPNKL